MLILTGWARRGGGRATGMTDNVTWDGPGALLQTEDCRSAA